VGLIGSSLVSQEGRKEQFRARRSELIRRPERPPYGERMHEGMTWGAVAGKRTTAIGLDEQTLPSTGEFLGPATDGLPTGCHDEFQNEVSGFGAERTSRTGTRKP
jgi:hypothetical protein